MAGRARSTLNGNGGGGGPKHWFGRFASRASDWLGSHWAFGIAMLVLLAWAITGPVFAFSTDWSLAINTITTIVTFMMVFVIQNTQNRDAAATHAKLDEIIRAIKEAHNTLIGLEREDPEEIDKARAHLEGFVEEPDDPKKQQQAKRAVERLEEEAR